MKKMKKTVIWPVLLCLILVNILVITPENVAAGNTTVAALKNTYPDGSAWDNNYVYDGATQCVAFAAKVFNLYYGKSFRSVPTHKDKSQVKAGDIIWYSATGVSTHNVWVIGRSGDTVTVGEGNAYCIHNRKSGRVCWGRTLNLNSITIKKVYSAPYAINDSSSSPSTPSDPRVLYSAKVEGTDGSLSVNDRPAATKNGAVQLTVIPENAVCRVFKSGDVGNWKKVIFNNITGYAWGPCLKKDLDPVGHIDSVTSPAAGKIRVVGWSFDYDAPDVDCWMNVYVGGPMGTGTRVGGGNSTVRRDDVNAAYPGVTYNHGYDLSFDCDQIGTQPVYMYVLNREGGNDSVFGPYYVNIACPHKNTYLLGAKSPTCSKEGYTGDTYCRLCNQGVAAGSTIAKTAHTWDEGKISVQPTETAEGLKTYTCTVCKETKTEVLAKLPAKEPEEPQKPQKPQEPQNPQNPQDSQKPQNPQKPQQTTTKTTVAPGTTVSDSSANGVYKVLADGKSVEYKKPVRKSSSVKIPDTIMVKGVSCKVVSISARAFKNNKTLKSVTIGRNVRKIGKQAFYNCKKLRNITIKTTSLKKNTIGSKAFTGTYKTAKVKVPAKQMKLYKKILRQRGMSAKAKYRK